MKKTPVVRTLAGCGKLSGLPPISMFKKVVKLVKDALNSFAGDATKDGINNENGLNRRLVNFINNISRQQDLPFLAGSEAMEVETNGNSPAADIGIFLHTVDMTTTPPKITVFEGKCLSSCSKTSRKREYVIGGEKQGQHKTCGGIERFKCSIHGRGFKHAGMIGYIQDRTPAHWLAQINGWISGLSGQRHFPEWRIEEHLSQDDITDKVSEYSSVVFRKDDKINLTHLWVDLSHKDFSTA